MRKAAALFVVLLWGLGQSAFPEGTATAGRGGRLELALAYPQEKAGFSFGYDLEKVLPVNNVALDRQPLDEAVAPRTVPEITASIVRKDSAPISLSFFLGRGNGDIFSSLHEQYAWRVKFKNLLMGAGIYRDIQISKGIRIQPYVGFIRSHAILRAAAFNGNIASYEYRLTAFCIGIPLVWGFN
jgi:hypothetical protein